MYQSNETAAMSSFGETHLSSQLYHLHGATMEIISRIANGEASKLSSIETTSLERKISENMSAMRLLLKDLELIWEESQDDEDAMHEVGSLLSSHTMQYEGLKRAISAAQVAARQKNEQLYHQQRQQLFAGASLASLQRQYQQQSDLVEGAKDVTSGLLRTRQVLAQQLEQAAGNIELLDTGNAVLTQAKEELQNQANLFKDSRVQISRLNRQSSFSRWSIFLVVLLFFSVATYIGYSRAPAPIKVPIRFVVNKGGQGAYFVLKQAGAGLKMAWWQASKGRVTSDEEEHSVGTKEPWLHQLEVQDKEEAFIHKPDDDSVSIEPDIGIPIDINVSVPYKAYDHADWTASVQDAAKQFKISLNESDQIHDGPGQATESAFVDDEKKAVETDVDNRGMLDVVSEMMEHDMQSMIEEDADAAVEVEKKKEDEKDEKAVETVVDNRGMLDVVSEMMEHDMQSVIERDADADVEVEKKEDDKEERSVVQSLLTLHKKPLSAPSKNRTVHKPRPEEIVVLGHDHDSGALELEGVPSIHPLGHDGGPLELEGVPPIRLDQVSNESAAGETSNQRPDASEGPDELVGSLEIDSAANDVKNLLDPSHAYDDHDDLNVYLEVQGDGATHDDNLPLPEGWSSHYDDLGRVYYYDSFTGESSYERPVEEVNEALVRVQEASFIHDLAEEYARKAKSG